MALEAGVVEGVAVYEDALHSRDAEAAAVLELDDEVGIRVERYGVERLLDLLLASDQPRLLPVAMRARRRRSERRRG